MTQLSAKAQAIKEDMLENFEEEFGEMVNDGFYGDDLEIGGKYKITLVSEGDRYDGHSFDMVFQINDDPELMLSIEGHYSSWNGSDIEVWDWKSVKPVQKTITVYEAV